MPSAPPRRRALVAAINPVSPPNPPPPFPIERDSPDPPPDRSPRRPTVGRKLLAEVFWQKSFGRRPSAEASSRRPRLHSEKNQAPVVIAAHQNSTPLTSGPRREAPGSNNGCILLLPWEIKMEIPVKERHAVPVHASPAPSIPFAPALSDVRTPHDPPCSAPCNSAGGIREQRPAQPDITTQGSGQDTIFSRSVSCPAG